MFRRIRPCPACQTPLSLFRSRPSPYARLLSFRLYECKGCETIYETGEVVLRQAVGETAKRYSAYADNGFSKQTKLP